MQSPKSKRSHAPGESPASDNNPIKNVGSPQGGTQPKQSGGSTVKSRANPKGSGNDKGGPMYHSRSAGASQAFSGGKAGYAGDSPDAQRKGGTSTQFPNGSE